MKYAVVLKPWGAPERVVLRTDDIHEAFAAKGGDPEKHVMNTETVNRYAEK